MEDKLTPKAIERQAQRLEVQKRHEELLTAGYMRIKANAIIFAEFGISQGTLYKILKG